MAVQEQETVVEQQPEESSAEDRLNTLLHPSDDSDLADEDAERTEEDSEESSEEDETKEEPQKPVEGPSVAMRALAGDRGVPDEWIELARDDEQLQAMIKMADKYRESSQEKPDTTQQSEEDVLEFLLPEEDFPKDDPIRKQFEKVQEHYSTKLKQQEQNMAQLVEIVKDMADKQDQTVQESQMSVQREFDSALDSLNNPSLGKSGQLSGPSGLLRPVVFDYVMQLRQQEPHVPVKDLTLRAAKEMGFEDPKAAALREQSGQRLGGAPSKPAPKPKKSGEEMLQAMLDGKLPKK